MYVTVLRGQTGQTNARFWTPMTRWPIAETASSEIVQAWMHVLNLLQDDSRCIAKSVYITTSVHTRANWSYADIRFELL